jgi:DNA polymerase-3 subunit beta
MKLTMQTSELTKALYRVQGVANRKSSMPILSHVLLTATAPNELKVSATDNDIGLIGIYEAQVSQSGSVAVQARQLYDISRSLAEANVDLKSQKNHWLDVHSGSSSFHLVGMPPADFPTLAEHDGLKRSTLPAAKLQQMIDRTVFCVSSDENRHNLSGIYCESPKAGVLRMVSTDGHRLAWAEAEFESTLNLERGAIVPRKGFAELKRVIGDSANVDSVQVGFSATNGVFEVGRVTLTTRLIDGQFPDYTQVIPQGSSRRIKLARGAFDDALRRVSLLAHGSAHGVNFKFSENTLDLVAEDPDLGDAHESIQVDYTGEPLSVGFNARYILDVLGLITEKAISFDLADNLSPGVLRPAEDSGFLAVVMPMRI